MWKDSLKRHWQSSLMDEGNTFILFLSITLCRCYPVLIKSDAIVSYVLTHSFCLAFVTMFEVEREYHGNRRTLSSDNLLYTWTYRTLGLQTTESFLLLNIRLLLSDSVSAKKDTLYVTCEFLTCSPLF